TFLRSGHADLRHAATDRHGAADKGGPSSSTRLLAVVIREGDSLLGQAVDVGRLVAHHAAVVVADVPGSNIIPPKSRGYWACRRPARGEPAPKQQTGRRATRSLLTFSWRAPWKKDHQPS